jgi:hypothetical protein
MPERYDDDYYIGGGAARMSRRSRYGARVSTWFGASLGLLLIVALVVWVYRLGHRDVTAIPVIRAALEPAKVQPDEPGGADVPHQDITSYSAGAEDTAGAAAAGAAPSAPTPSAPTEITFAPPPERPTEEDVAMGALQTGPSDAPPPPPEAGPRTDEGPEAESLDATDLAPAASPVVRRRPADLSARMAAARRAVSEEAELAARAAASQVQIQLGAFPDRNVTTREWERIYRANEDILQGRALVVQSTISGGRRFFRLRVGPFRDRIEAQNVCRALQARGHDCLVAVNG